MSEEHRRSRAQRLKDFLFRRKQAYSLVFDPASPAAVRVLQDLARFCRADRSTFHLDPRGAAQLDGRREVWLRIMQHVKMDQHEFIAKYGLGEVENE